MESQLTPRQAITWAELIVALIIWGYYGWSAFNDATPGVPLGEALFPAVPWIILAIGASLITRVAVWVFARSPALSEPGIRDYPGGFFGFRAYVTGMTLREAFAILAGKRKGFGPFASEAEHAAWRAGRRPALIAMAVAAIVTGSLILTASASGPVLWETPAGRLTLWMNALAVVLLVGLAAHRIGFLLRASRPG